MASSGQYDSFKYPTKRAGRSYSSDRQIRSFCSLRYRGLYPVHTLWKSLTFNLVKEYIKEDYRKYVLLWICIARMSFKCVIISWKMCLKIILCLSIDIQLYNLAEDLDIRPEILFSSAWSLFALLKRRANKDQNFLFVFHYSHSA